MIKDCKKWHCLAVKSFCKLWHGIYSHHNDELNSELKSHVNVCKTLYCCNTKMSERWIKILRFTQKHKSVNTPFFFFADTECLLEKLSSCENDPTIAAKIKKYKA